MLGVKRREPVVGHALRELPQLALRIGYVVQATSVRAETPSPRRRALVYCLGVEKKGPLGIVSQHLDAALPTERSRARP